MPSRQPMTSVPPAAPLSGIPGSELLSQKQRGESVQKNYEEKLTSANKEITAAKIDAHTTIAQIPKMDVMRKIFDKEEIGRPELEGIWGATNLLSMNRSNAQIKRLNEEMVSSLAGLGQSQLWNTIVETQMRGAKIPGLFTEPQLNRIQWATLRSTMDQQQKYPAFLEKWQTTHDGTLTGANDAWIDYATHNPSYAYTTDPRGTVLIKKMPSVIEPKVWMTLRSLGSVDTIPQNAGPDKVYLKNKRGNWVERE
jgi:hypothetical protein